MAKTPHKLQRYLFWVWDFAPRDFFVGIGVTCVYRFSFMYVKHSGRGTSLKVNMWRYRVILPHPLLKPISDVHFCHFWYVCRSFRIFRACLGPQKHDSFWRRRRNIAVISQAISANAILVASGKCCPALNAFTGLWQVGFKGYSNESVKPKHQECETNTHTHTHTEQYIKFW